MLYNIPKTRMLSAAQDSLSPDTKPRSIFIESMIFLLIMLICSVPQSFLLTAVALGIVFADTSYHGLLANNIVGDEINTDAIIQYIDEKLAAGTSEILLTYLISSGFFILAAIIYCRAIEKRSLFSVGFSRRCAPLEYLLGIAVGAVMITVPVIICHATGCVTLSFNKEISPAHIILFFIAFVIQGMGEEVIFRGYFLTTLCRRNNEWVAIITSSLMFTLFHTSNQGFSFIAFINITLFGIFAAVFMLKRGSIWAVSAIHTAWNFMQGNIFGFSVSGMEKMPSILGATDQGFGSILSGGDFGIEGGLGATVVLLIALLSALMMPAKKRELAPLDSSPEKETITL